MSRLPALVGRCIGDVAGIASFVNSAERRLIFAKEAGDEGWYGTFAEIAFNTSRDTPYITLPRHVARIQAMVVCDRPVAIHNQFYEYLDFGSGRMPKNWLSCCDNQGLIDTFQRNTAITFQDVTADSYIRVYATNAADEDASRRVLIQGKDASGAQVFTIDNRNNVEGEFVNLTSPFSQTVNVFAAGWITGIQKDVTIGQVHIFAVNASSGVETLILTMEPGETVAGYARYYIDNLPLQCCPSSSGTVPGTIQVKCIAKLEPIPVKVDTDYLLLHNIEAIIEEAQSVRLSEADSLQAKQMALDRHVQAVRYLNAELVHYYGKDNPAVNFKPFGSANLERLAINMQ